MSGPPRVMILGATGFIGRGLAARFAAHGFGCTGVSRRGGMADVPGFDRWQTPGTLDLTGHLAVINLAGEQIGCRWTAHNRQRIHVSRVGVTRQVVKALARVPPGVRPQVLVNGSAVGIYGDRGDEVLTESSSSGSGFLADLCREWEAAAGEAEALGVRVVRMRTGVVLGTGGGALHQLMGVFKTGLGGRLGSGRQWMPWIHLDDLRRAIIHAVLCESLVGAVNGTAPAAERNREFTRKLAAALHRPALLPVPGIVLKIALDGFGAALLEGQHARPAALEATGFQFHFATLEAALADLIC